MKEKIRENKANVWVNRQPFPQKHRCKKGNKQPAPVGDTADDIPLRMIFLPVFIRSHNFSSCFLFLALIFVVFAKSFLFLMGSVYHVVQKSHCLFTQTFALFSLPFSFIFAFGSVFLCFYHVYLHHSISG